MDYDRVYASDMKKMVNWFSALQKHNIDFTPAEQPETEGEEPADEKKNVAETLEAAGEKVVLEVTPDSVPETAETKTKRTRKKKTEE